jgi:hypothetical protein
MNPFAALNLVLGGAIAMASAIVGMFFLRFWRSGRDRFFLLFASSFFVEALDRLAIALSEHPNEGAPAIDGVRLLADQLILLAVAGKNRAERAPRQDSSG